MWHGPGNWRRRLHWIADGNFGGRKSDQRNTPSTTALIVGVVFALFAVIGVLAGLQPIVFDAGKGWFRCTWRSPEKTNPSLTSETAVRLTRVRAIQLLSKRVENSDDKTFIIAMRSFWLSMSAGAFTSWHMAVWRVFVKMRKRFHDS